MLEKTKQNLIFIIVLILELYLPAGSGAIVLI